MIPVGPFRILCCFYENNTLGFAELCREADYPTDLGGYYIRQLIKSKHIEKVDRGQYKILSKGKQELALHLGHYMDLARPRLCLIIVARQAQEYLVIRRETQPFIGVTEWPAQVVDGGMQLSMAARRTAKDRLGVQAEPLLFGFFRRIDMYSGAQFDDKLFAVHTLELPDDASLSVRAATGTIQRYTARDLPKIDRPSRAMLDILAFVERDSERYEEHMYDLTEADMWIVDDTPENK